MKRLLHIAEEKIASGVWLPVFQNALRELGELTLIENGKDVAKDEIVRLMRECDVLMTSWGALRIPLAVAEDPGNLSYVCNVTGTLRKWVPIEITDAGIPMTNWGDLPANPIAEGAMALLLATMKDLHHRIQTIRSDGWRVDAHTHGGRPEEMNIGVYGFGVIGRKFVEMLRPFGCTIRIYDPFVDDVPDDCIRVNGLDDLFSQSQAVVIHAGWTEDTEKSVTADLLAKLPDHGILINTARGQIVDQDGLFKELESGRLRAGLDVLDPELPEGHPARKWENLILTSHSIGDPWPDDHKPPTELTRMHRISLDNLERHFSGRPLRFIMDRRRYLLSS